MISTYPQLGDWTTFEELRALQDAQLSRTLHHIHDSPFYRERVGAVPRCDDQYPQQADLTTKEDLRTSYPYGMLAVPKERVATYHESSGSTGRPSPAYYTADEWVDLAERFARKSVPFTASDALLVRIPYGLVLAGHMAHHAAFINGATVIPGDCRSLAVPYSRVVRILHDLEVTLTWSTPSESLIWAAAAKVAGHGREDFPALRALYVAGEPVSPARRTRLENLWNAPVVEEYGCTEVGPLAGDCPRGEMHFWADRVLPEIYDSATGEIRREGTGQLVITPLYREAMPLFRYNLEDLVELRYEDCGCGWRLPKIKVLGRVGQGFSVAGARLTEVQVEEYVFRLPEDYGVLFWRARAEPDHLVVQIEVQEMHAKTACAELAKAIEAELDVRCQVSALPVGTIVPDRLLEVRKDAMKPRKLFGPDENWDNAVVRG